MNWCLTSLSFARCLLYLYHSSLVIGMLLRLVGIKECALGTQSLGMVCPLSDVGTRVGALLSQSSPPHNSGMPFWSGDRNTHTQSWLGKKSDHSDMDTCGSKSSYFSICYVNLFLLVTNGNIAIYNIDLWFFTYLIYVYSSNSKGFHYSPKRGFWMNQECNHDYLVDLIYKRTQIIFWIRIGITITDYKC